VRETEIADEGYIHIFYEGEKVNSKKLVYDSNTGYYNGQFWASNAGKIEYEIELSYGNRSLIVNSGSVIVQESQIETNNVYLNQKSLKKIAENTDGVFYFWKERLSILDKVNKESINQISYIKIILHRHWLVFIIIILLLTLEWVYKRKIGMI